jgi:hypothetical protein
VDTEIAKELLKVNQEMRGIINELKSVNKDIFAKGFTNQGNVKSFFKRVEFVPEIRKSLRKGLANYSNL